ncbi:MAG: hypothetical protein ACXADX_20055 [Candidatus Hodarchaeales archaeon]|jgi:hypothetical protein
MDKKTRAVNAIEKKQLGLDQSKSWSTERGTHRFSVSYFDGMSSILPKFTDENGNTCMKVYVFIGDYWEMGDKLLGTPTNFYTVVRKTLNFLMWLREKTRLFSKIETEW